MIENEKNKAIALFVAGNLGSWSSEEERQDIFRKFASEHDLKIVAFLAIDNSNIAMGIMHAIELCSEYSGTLVIFDEPNIFFLPQRSLVDVLAWFVDNDVSIGFASDNSVIEKSALSNFQIMIQSSLDAEIKNRSDLIKESLMLKKKRGAKLGGRRFGSKSDELYVVNQILKLKEMGLSLQKICDKLYENKIKTVQGKIWHPTTVKRILDRASKSR